MFSSSARFVARSSPVSAIPATVRPSSIVIIASSSGLTSTRTNQRRYSSSKPPVPPSDGSRGIDASSQTPAKGVNPSKKECGEKCEGKTVKRRNCKDASNVFAKSKNNEPFLNLPSVPSTQHLHPKEIYVASFFSTYRPISVTNSVPPHSNPDSFYAIFSWKKPSKPRPHDNINTLSPAVNSMENVPPNSQSNSHLGNNNTRSAISQGSAKHAKSNQLSGVDELPIEDMLISKKLRPFEPPPPPVPMDSFGEQDIPSEDELSESELQEGVREQSYSTVLTITESTHTDGRKTYEAHSSPLVSIDNKDAPSSSVYEGEKVIQDQGGSFSISEPEPVYRRQHRILPAIGRRIYHAISVKRQRKLKMKKHKHKKLMRRTRMLRRKLDKA
ncbi:hypothetical protein GX48_06643 [Paracoccidioides brasiliensis]|nr:hypothetical protein GX48_06643 [Paracoccidioides brasiliensis]